jgi:predicted nucleic acid-binding protein
MLTILPNVKSTTIFYKWNLIQNDEDDNKFVDAYLSSNADFLVSNDKHFNQLNSIEFPKVNVISAEKLIEILSIKI